MRAKQFFEERAIAYTKYSGNHHKNMSILIINLDDMQFSLHAKYEMKSSSRSKI